MGDADAIAITGVGVVSALGSDRPSFAAAIRAGMDAVRGDPPMGILRAHAAPPPDPCALLALEAARAAVRDAGVDPSSKRLALVMGTSAGGLGARALFEADRTKHRSLLAHSLTESLLRYVADGIDLGGPALAVTTACTASATAIAHACLLLSAELADVVVAGGADAVSDPLVAGFTALGAMSAAPCAPFSEPHGMNLGEGACFFVLERARDAEARGRSPLGFVLGHGLSSDAHHATAPEPSGAGLARAMQAALTHAGLDPDSIGYLSAHGTGTEANDSSEMRAIRRVFGGRADQLPISSSKSMIGHALGAAAALESLAALEGMRGGFFPPTIHFSRPRSDAPKDPIERPRSGSYQIAMKTSAAFGGANAALILGSRASSIAREKEQVFVAGVASLGATDDPIVPRLDLSALDRQSQWLTAVVARALDSARIRIRRELADRAGLFVAAAQLPGDATRDFFQSLRARGADRGSATAFSRMVMNGPAGAASRMLSLRGPLSVLAGGCGTTLLALVQASLHLQRGEADLLVVGSAEVEDADLAIVRGAVFPTAAAAICLVTGSFMMRAGLRPLARVGAVGLVGRGQDATELLPRARRTIIAEGPGETADASILAAACRSIAAEGSAAVKTAAAAVLLERC